MLTEVVSRHTLLLVSLIAGLVGVAPAYGQDFWQGTNGPYGGTIRTIAVVYVAVKYGLRDAFAASKFILGEYWRAVVSYFSTRWWRNR